MILKKRHIDTVLLISTLLLAAHLEGINKDEEDIYLPSFISSYISFQLYLITVFLSTIALIADKVDINGDGLIGDDECEEGDVVLYKYMTRSFFLSINQTLLTLIISSTQYFFINVWIAIPLVSLNSGIYIFLLNIARREKNLMIED